MYVQILLNYIHVCRRYGAHNWFFNILRPPVALKNRPWSAMANQFYFVRIYIYIYMSVLVWYVCVSLIKPPLVTQGQMTYEVIYIKHGRYLPGVSKETWTFFVNCCYLFTYHGHFIKYCVMVAIWFLIVLIMFLLQHGADVRKWCHDDVKLDLCQYFLSSTLIKSQIGIKWKKHTSR